MIPTAMGFCTSPVLWDAEESWWKGGTPSHNMAIDDKKRQNFPTIHE